MPFCPQCGTLVSMPSQCPSCLAARQDQGGDKPIEQFAPTVTHGNLGANYQAAWERLKTATITIAGHTLRFLTALAGVIGAIVLGLTSFTLVGFLTGNVSLICGAGLLWILFLLQVFSFARSARQVADWIGGHAEILAERFEMSHHDALELATWLSVVVSRISRWFSTRLFFVMGSTVALVRTFTDLHMFLANHQLHVPVSGIRLPWLVNAGFTFIPPVLGMIADLRSRVNKDPRKIGTAIRFITSLEFARCLLLLTCGLWGAQAFEAAQEILKIPSNDTIQGVPILLPLGLFSAPARAAAFTLYEIQGVYVYLLLFVVLPGFVLLCAFWCKLKTKIFRRPFVPPIFGLASKAGILSSVWLLLLSSSVAYRTGAMGRYATAGVMHFQREPLDKGLSDCLLGSHGPVTDSNCIQVWERGWDLELQETSRQVLLALPPKYRSQFLHDQQVWRKREVDPSRLPADGHVSLKEKQTILFNQGTNIRRRVQSLRSWLQNRKRGSRRG
jgi:hypothetical protein